MTLRLRSPDEIERTNPLRARYVRMLIHAATTGEPERPSPMDAGLVLCDALAGRPICTPRLREKRENLVDAGGHRRPFYAGLICQAVAMAARLELGVGRVDVAQTLLATLGASNLFTGTAGASETPGHACATAWDQVARVSFGHLANEIEDATTDVIARRNHGSSAFSLLSRPMQPSGAFFPATSENPEPRWYHELVMLHAAATAAMVGEAAGDVMPKDAGKLVREAALFHHAETQPDHATSQPWAIHAFLSDPEFTPTADLMLLAAGVNQPGSLDAVSRILLADAAVCLSLPDPDRDPPGRG